MSIETATLQPNGSVCTSVIPTPCSLLAAFWLAQGFLQGRFSRWDRGANEFQMSAQPFDCSQIEGLVDAAAELAAKVGYLLEGGPAPAQAPAGPQASQAPATASGAPHASSAAGLSLGLPRRWRTCFPWPFELRWPPLHQR